MPVQSSDYTFNQDTIVDSPYEISAGVTVEIADGITVEISVTGVALEDPEVRVMV